MFGTPATLAIRGISLRGLRDDDLSWLRALYAQTRTEELATVPWSPAQRDAFLAQQFDAQHRHYVGVYADADFLAICEGDTPVGRLYLQRTPPAHRIVDISLSTQARGCGIGAALIEAVQRDAAARARDVELHVLQANAGAQRLYRRLGFAVTGEAPPYFAMRWSRDRSPLS